MPCCILCVAYDAISLLSNTLCTLLLLLLCCSLVPYYVILFSALVRYAAPGTFTPVCAAVTQLPCFGPLACSLVDNVVLRECYQTIHLTSND